MATDNKLKKKIGINRHASAIKQARQSEKRNFRNRDALTAVKTAIKKARASKSKTELAKTIPIIAKAAQKKLIHKKKASRLISRLTKACA